MAALATAALLGAGTVGAQPVEAQAGPVAYTLIEDDGCAFASVDLTTGDVTAIGSFSGTACVADLAVGPDGEVYGAQEVSNGALAVHLVRFDVTTGTPSDLGALTGTFSKSTLFGEELGIAFGPDNEMYVGMGTDDPGCAGFVCLYRVDPTTRVATLVGPPGGPSGPFDDKPLISMTAGCSGPLWTTVLRAESDPAKRFLTTLDLTTGAATQGAEFELPRNLWGLELDKATGTLYATADDSESGEAIYSVDPTTGAATKLANVEDNKKQRILRLAIPGSCADPKPEPPAPTVIEPKFTG